VVTALGTLIQGAPLDPADKLEWPIVRAFYEQRAGVPAWVTDTPTERAAHAIAVLQSAPAHGLVPDDYQAADLAGRHDALKTLAKDAPNRAEALADFDGRLTAALITFGHDVAVGRSKPPTRGWQARRTLPDLATTLNAAAHGDIATWVPLIQPRHPEYEALRQALMDLRAREHQGAARPPSNADEIRVFQEHHALPATGTLDAITRAAMAVPLADRVHQVEVNLERWRWMPDDLGVKHLLVNIPYFHLQARENGTIVKDIRVVVGKPGHETPIFSDEVETVVFSPYWNIPDTIAEGETAPAQVKDPRYLARNNIEVHRAGDSGGRPVDPGSVNWDDPEAVHDLQFRQRPGPGNALGHVKFLFPNSHNVYLHDTPADQLFARPGRAFSHGCVRVEEPEVLAQYLLRADPEWNLPRIRAAMQAGVEKHVRLTEKVPVHIVYFTAWVDDRKGLHFQPDVYGYDKK
jgi:murein L,D-transpeptidase YcbB/YkuD